MLTEKKIRHLSMIASEYVNKKKIVEIKEITSGNINSGLYVEAVLDKLIYFLYIHRLMIHILL